jgi:ubiquinol-cytochrome c reductase cytochrome c subunit
MTAPLNGLLRRRRLLAGPLALFALAAVAGSILFFSGGSAHGQGATVSTDPADIQAGEVLYQSHCQSCHGFQGLGGQVGAPPLVSAGAAAADFYLTTGRMPLNNPANQPVRHRPFFNPVQIGQLVAYINALPVITGTNMPGPGIPTVAPLCPTPVAPTPNPTGCVTLSDGQRLFQVNCAQCHQAAGSGGMLSKGNVVPGLHNANIVQVAEAIRVGPRPMPDFGPQELNDQQLSAISQYVQYLHHPSNPGGLGITHFGPVAEGFVGVIFGFGLLWFGVRMIGARR